MNSAIIFVSLSVLIGKFQKNVHKAKLIEKQYNKIKKEQKEGKETTTTTGNTEEKKSDDREAEAKDKETDKEKQVGDLEAMGDQVKDFVNIVDLNCFIFKV